MKKKVKIIISILIFILLIFALLFFTISKDKPKTDPITIGVILPLTGFGSYSGIPAQKGAIFAVENLDINNVKIIIEDSKGFGNIAVDAANKLINIDNVDILLTTFSSPSISVGDLANDKNILHLYSSGTSQPSLTHSNSIKIGDYDYEEDCKILGKYILDQNYTSVAYIYAQVDASLKCIKGIKEVVEDKIKIENYPFETEKEDFKTIITKVKNNDYNAILNCGYEVDNQRLYNKFIEYEITTPYICVIGKEECFLNKLMDIAPEGSISYGIKTMDQEYKKKILEKYPNLNGYEIFAATETYDAIQDISYAYNKCESKNKECIAKELTSSNRKRVIDYTYTKNIIKYNIAIYKLENKEFIEINN